MSAPKWPFFHPPLVHFPQGLFPVAFVAFALYLATEARDLEVGAYLAAAFGAITSPLTTITGFIDWKVRYKGYMTSVFKIKIICAIILIALSGAAVLLRTLAPDVASLPLSGPGWVYAGLLAACLATCIVLGHYGGKLVFH